MAKKCGECINLDWNNRGTYSIEKYYCKEGHGYREPRENACSYDFIQSGSNHSSSGWKPSGFSWITIMIQKFHDIFCGNCAITEGLLSYGEAFLIKNPLYGDAIEKSNQDLTLTDDEQLSFYASLTSRFVLPWMEAIKENNQDMAMDIFHNMIDALLEKMEIKLVREQVRQRVLIKGI